MVVVHIDTIHGDMLVTNMKPELGLGRDETLPVAEVVARYPDTWKLTLSQRQGRAVYRAESKHGTRIVDAETGSELPPVNAIEAASIARYHHATDAAVSAVSRIESDPPTEIQFASLPLWRVDFDDAWGSSFYIDPTTGDFVTRRHTLWRVFDFLWMLHIMDYEERDNVNNTLLQGATMMALLFALSGLWLLYFRFRPRRR
jgi:uncharacterized iron-regulated membrane protein